MHISVPISNKLHHFYNEHVRLYPKTASLSVLRPMAATTSSGYKAHAMRKWRRSAERQVDVVRRDARDLLAMGSGSFLNLRYVRTFVRFKKSMKEFIISMWSFRRMLGVDMI